MREVTKTNQNIKHFSILLLAAFAAVYIFWGSTVSRHQYAIETLPPFLMAGSRFISPVRVLYIGRVFQKITKSRVCSLAHELLVGTLLLLAETAGVVLAQHYIYVRARRAARRHRAVLIVLLGWLWLKGARPNWKVALRTSVGFVGV
jgi:hypothetical protein